MINRSEIRLPPAAALREARISDQLRVTQRGSAATEVEPTKHANKREYENTEFALDFAKLSECDSPRRVALDQTKRRLKTSAETSCTPRILDAKPFS
jgi:hypothetical protein